ncbi:MAG: homoserine kinase [Crocinitomicaceae bacterium]|nr:homoserine kinase [Crocinitomicaceae bacterium]
METVRAYAPATIANFNVGYDLLGVSLNNIGDEVHLTFNGRQNNAIIEIVNGDGLPLDVKKNCCSVVIAKMQEKLNVHRGVDIRIVKGFSAGSGLGSSSASSAAAAFGYNELMGRPFGRKELIRFASEGERVACGTAHFDNVAPAILGGIVLVTGTDQKEIIQLPVIDDLHAITLFPKLKINTEDSRKVLKTNIESKAVVKQVGLMGAFVSSLYEKDLERFSASLQDVIVEPIRSRFIPKFEEMRSAVMKAKGLAFGISGSGPSVFAIVKGKGQSKEVLKELLSVFDEVDLVVQTEINKITNNSGARLLK